MYVPNCRRCPLTSKLTGFVLNISKSCTLCPLTLTQSEILVKYGCVWQIRAFLSFYLSRDYYVKQDILRGYCVKK
ncbi:hypothetical protein Hanom_Chr14g01249001 [Helianthus anomalus]